MRGSDLDNITYEDLLSIVNDLPTVESGGEISLERPRPHRDPIYQCVVKGYTEDGFTIKYEYIIRTEDHDEIVRLIYLFMSDEFNVAGSKE